MQKACNNFRNREINTEEEGFLRIRDTIILFSISNFTRLFLLPPRFLEKLLGNGVEAKL